MAIGSNAETRTIDNTVHLYLGGSRVGQKPAVNNTRQDHERIIRLILGECEITYRGTLPNGFRWSVIVK